MPIRIRIARLCIVVMTVAAVGCGRSSTRVDRPVPSGDRFARTVEWLVSARRATDALLYFAATQTDFAPAGVPPGEVVGVVQAWGTGRPLAGVQVYVEGAEVGARSDSAGSFRISDLQPGRLVLGASLLGYVEVTVPLELPVTHGAIVVLRMEERSLIQCAIVIPASAGGAGSVWLRVMDAQTSERLSVPVTLRVSDGIDEWTAVNGSPGTAQTLRTVAGVGRGPFAFEVSAPGYMPWLGVVPRLQKCSRWSQDVWLRRTGN